MAPRGGKHKPQPKKPPLTHFLCLPLVSTASRDSLTGALTRFREEAANVACDDASRAAVSGAVRPVGTLHLTLGVMSLRGDGEVERAVAALRELEVHTLLEGESQDGDSIDAEIRGNTAADRGPAPLVVTLESLHAMRAPASTSSLFMAPRDATSRLHPFCERLRRRFVENRLMVDEERPLKLHATVVNTIYAKPRGQNVDVKGAGAPKEKLDDESARHENAEQIEHVGNGEKQSMDVSGSRGGKTTERRGRAAPLLFDARPLLEHFKHTEWVAGLRLDRIALCKMGAQKVFDAAGNIVDEAYEEVAVRELPGS